MCKKVGSRAIFTPLSSVNVKRNEYFGRRRKEVAVLLRLLRKKLQKNWVKSSGLITKIMVSCLNSIINIFIHFKVLSWFICFLLQQWSNVIFYGKDEK